MKSAGLLNAFAYILGEAVARLVPVRLRNTMSLTLCSALCILGLDFLIYAFFHRIYGDKRSAVARQVAAFKDQSPSLSTSLERKPFTSPNTRPIENSAEKRTDKRVHSLGFDGCVTNTI